MQLLLNTKNHSFYSLKHPFCNGNGGVLEELMRINFSLILEIAYLPMPLSHLPVPLSHLPVPLSHLPVPLSHLPVPLSHLPVPLSHMFFK